VKKKDEKKTHSKTKAHVPDGKGFGSKTEFAPDSKVRMSPGGGSRKKGAVGR